MADERTLILWRLARGIDPATLLLCSQQIFRTAEDNARTNERGLWSPSTCAA